MNMTTTTPQPIVTPITEIEQELLTAAKNDDMATISSVISGLTATQKGEITPSVFDTVLQSVANYSTTHSSAADQPQQWRIS
jgi:hypothetical protein